MKDVHFIDSAGRAYQLLKPLRIEILKCLEQPCSCTEIGKQLELTPQKVHYHVKVREKAGLVRRVDQRQKRGMQEGGYEAVARSFWLSPELVQQQGGAEKAGSRMSFGYVQNLAQMVLTDVGYLSTVPENPPCLGMDARIRLRSKKERAAFAAELQGAIQHLAQKYAARGDGALQGSSETDFKLVLTCYPDLAGTEKKVTD